MTTDVSTLSSKLLFFSVFSTAIWCFFVGISAIYTQPLIYTFVAEIIKSFAWGMLCINLLLREKKLIKLLTLNHQFSWFFAVVVISAIVLTLAIHSMLDEIYWLFMSLLMLSISHLVMVEFLYRQGSAEFKWGFKPLAMAIAAYAIVDLSIYSTSILTTQLNHDLFWLRGAIYICLIPLLIIGIKRHKSLGVKLFISREVVFHSTLLLGISLYLIIMSVVGYFLKFIDSEWGALSQFIFIILALCILLFLFLNESLRNKIKVFITKHFFANRYDYRQQWLKLNANLASEQFTDYKETALNALMDLFEIKQGALFLFDKNDNIELGANLGASINSQHWRSFLNNYRTTPQQWIIDLDEYERFPEIYPNTIMNLTSMLNQNMRIVVPMQGQENLSGYFVLSRPSHNQILNYEDRDLLSTAAQQLANFIALNQANQEILEASQFAAFNRMSAFLVHDLKNIVAQLSLVSSNAVHHKNNPEFIEDTFETVENSVMKMNKMLSQLRSKKSEDSHERAIELNSIFEEVVASCANQQPQVQAHCKNSVILFLNPEKLTNIIMHLVQNSQQACTDNDSVDLRYNTNKTSHFITIEDTGCGMSEPFVKTRLFKPFDTTKGNAGMGIGAYEAKQYIESIGGEISVSSNEQEGTRISLHLPLDVLVPAKDVLNNE